MRTTTFLICGCDTARWVTSELVWSSARFQVEPLPDNYWEVTVKDDIWPHIKKRMDAMAIPSVLQNSGESL